MKIQVLAENTSSGSEFGAEHGLSLYIETGLHKILFDMGQTDLFAQNAQKLGTDLKKVDFAILSHGHYDHGGGLHRFLALNQTAPVYLRKDAFLPHYNGTEKYIGLDPELRSNPRFVYTDDIFSLDRGITLYSCNDRIPIFPCNSYGLNIQENGSFRPDNFRHEQYLLIEESGKRVLFSGCSHKGILNIAQWFQPDVLIGGFHFKKIPIDESGTAVLRNAAEFLLKFPAVYYTGHCTGERQYEILHSIMENRLYKLSSGLEIRI